MSTPYEAFVFARPSSPRFAGQEFGHVGWGFQLSPGRFMVGAVENYAGTPYSVPGKAGFWSEETSQPLLRHALGTQGPNSRYDLYRALPVVAPDPTRALAAQEWVSRQPYKVTGQNCMNATAQILSAYGVRGLPSPNELENYFPINWFRHLGMPSRVLTASDATLDVAFYEHPEFEGEVWRVREANTDFARSALGVWDGRIGSIAVRSGTVTLHQSPNFGGASITLNQSYSFLGGWSRQARSLRIQTARATPPETPGLLDCPALAEPVE